MKYYLMIHDRDFFVANINALALSKELFTLEGKLPFLFLIFKLIFIARLTRSSTYANGSGKA